MKPVTVLRPKRSTPRGLTTTPKLPVVALLTGLNVLTQATPALTRVLFLKVTRATTQHTTVLVPGSRTMPANVA